MEFFYSEEDPVSKKTQGIAMIMHEALCLMKFLQRKPKERKMNVKSFQYLYYTIIFYLSDGGEK